MFQSVDIPIAVYEYNQDMRRVLATKKLGEILMIPEEELRTVLADRTLFVERIRELCAEPLAEEKEVYLLEGSERRYVRITSYEGEGRTLGIVIDVTEAIVEKQQIEQERDIDLLTG
ncbi:GGDEF domain-containing protein, partial [Anaerotignum faecicola]|nr:GGDEF domain-containing protein [Anaerotignum faecicola]